MKTIQTNLFEYKELSTEAKEVARLEYHEKYNDLPFLYESLMERANENPLFNVKELRYSLSYCQGDGLCFSSSLNISKYIDTLSLKESIKHILKVRVHGYTEAERKRASYYYASKSDVNFEIDLSREKYPNLYKLAIQIATHFTDEYMELCKCLVEEGYSHIEFPNNIEEMLEVAECEDSFYYENGKRY